MHGVSCTLATPFNVTKVRVSEALSPTHVIFLKDLAVAFGVLLNPLPEFRVYDIAGLLIANIDRLAFGVLAQDVGAGDVAIIVTADLFERRTGPLQFLNETLEILGRILAQH